MFEKITCSIKSAADSTVSFVKENRNKIAATVVVCGAAYYYREYLTAAVAGCAVGCLFHEEIESGIKKVAANIYTGPVVKVEVTV